jgi:hypothetical protein
MDASGSAVSGGGVYTVTYTWRVDRVYSRTDGADDVATLLSANKTFASITSSSIAVPNNTFPSSSDVYITLSVNSSVFSLVSEKQILVNVTSTANPSLSITGAGQAYVYSAVTLVATIIYPSCYVSLIPDFDYFANLTWAVQSTGSSIAQSTVDSWISSSTTQLQVPAFSLDAGSSYVFMATYTSVLDASVKIASTATVTALTSAPVALFTVGGGTYPRDSSSFVLNASTSYDPNSCTLAATCSGLYYSYGCSYASTDLACSNFSTTDSSVLYPDLAAIAQSDAEFEVVFTLEVYSRNTKLSSCTSIRVFVLESDARYIDVQLQTLPSTVNPTDEQYISGYVGTASSQSNASLTVSSVCSGSGYADVPMSQIADTVASTLVFATSSSKAILPANTLAPFTTYTVTLSLTSGSSSLFSQVMRTRHICD